jgi:hypothetical protein
MNGNDHYLGQLAGHYQQAQAPKSIMDQLREKEASLKANLAKVDAWKAELAQCERMLAAAEEPKP